MIQWVLLSQWARMPSYLSLMISHKQLEFLSSLNILTCHSVGGPSSGDKITRLPHIIFYNLIQAMATCSKDVVFVTNSFVCYQFSLALATSSFATKTCKSDPMRSPCFRTLASCVIDLIVMFCCARTLAPSRTRTRTTY